MKSKEEIEQLAESEYPIKRGGSEWMPTTNDIKKATKQEGYIDGYTQCQEDMADKKYTEEDMGKLWQYVIDGAKSILLGNGVTIGNFEDYINSLNKQD